MYGGAVRQLCLGVWHFGTGSGVLSPLPTTPTPPSLTSLFSVCVRPRKTYPNPTTPPPAPLSHRFVFRVCSTPANLAQ